MTAGRKSTKKIEEFVSANPPPPEEHDIIDLYEMEKVQSNPIFVWWHSFVHEFINQLSFDSGFMTVSLGERVYCFEKEIKLG